MPQTSHIGSMPNEQPGDRENTNAPCHSPLMRLMKCILNRNTAACIYKTTLRASRG